MSIVPTIKAHVNPELIHHAAIRGILNTRYIEQCARGVDHRWRRSAWSPGITLITFLLQVLDGAKTVRSAVALRLAHLSTCETDVTISTDPSAYCQARQRLPIKVIEHLLQTVGDMLWSTREVTATWCGRRVWVVDGSSTSMPDTQQLQAVYPQPSGQREGCGFPVAKFVAVFCHATGAIVDLAIGSIDTSELPLLRSLFHRFAPGDVVLGDRAYCAYTDMALLKGRGVHSVFRLHQRRKADFRRGLRLGKDDVVAEWTRPVQWRPCRGLSFDAFNDLPETMPVRLVRVRHMIKGFRNRKVVIATTLLDPVESPAEELRALYRNRWTVELNLRSLKTHMGMEVLRCRSVDMVAKEIAMHVLAYNLIRLVMWHAAREAGRDPHRLSFTGTLHRLRHALPLILLSRIRLDRVLANHLSIAIATDVTPSRLNRYEPRRVKRRTKQYSLLIKPREHYQKHGDPDGR